VEVQQFRKEDGAWAQAPSLHMGGLYGGREI